MTKNNDATRSFEIILKHLIIPPAYASGDLKDAIETIRTALLKSAQVDGLITAMTKIQTISAHMQSKRSFELNKIASDALHQFSAAEI